MTSVRLVKHLTGQLLHGRRVYGLLALAAVPGVVAWVAGGGETEVEKLELYDTIVAQLSGLTLAIAVLVVGASVMRDEKDSGTLPFLYLSPIPRWQFAVASWIAAAGVATLVAFGGWAVGWLGLGLSSGNWSHGLAALSAYVAAAFGYSAVFLPIGYLFTRAILVGLGYVFVWEGIMTNVMTGLAPSSIWRMAMSIFGGIRELPAGALEVLDPVLPSVGGGISKILATVVLGVGVFAWALRRRDAL